MREYVATAKVKKLTPATKLRVETQLTSEFVLRLWLGRRLMRLACWVMGCSAEFVEPT